MSEVKVGQVWEDCDRRMHGRRVEVLEVDATHALVKVATTGRRTRIRLDRFKPVSTGYRLVGEAS